jgi:ribosomal protein S18 acetylase RimI-like enzyme
VSQGKEAAVMETERIDLGNGFFISTKKENLDIERIYNFLSEQSYWAKGIKKELVKEMIQNAPLCFGLYANDGKQAGFARVITDFVRFGWVCDVFILAEYRGRSLGKQLVDTIVSHPKLKGACLMLATDDAHGLYEKYGFAKIENQQKLLMRSMDMKAVEKSYGL